MRRSVSRFLLDPRPEAATLKGLGFGACKPESRLPCPLWNNLQQMAYDKRYHMDGRHTKTICTDHKKLQTQVHRTTENLE